MDDAEGEAHEGGGVAAAVGGFQGGVVFLLMVADEGLDRDELKGGMIVIE
jgi:hypothetical protein